MLNLQSTKDTLFAAAKRAEKNEIAAREKYNALEIAEPFDREAYEAATQELAAAGSEEDAAWAAYDAAAAEGESSV